MLKTAIGTSSDLSAALEAAVQEYNNSTGTKEYHSAQFLIDTNTNLYVVVIMYTAFEQAADLPPVEKKESTWYIGQIPLEQPEGEY